MHLFILTYKTLFYFIIPQVFSIFFSGKNKVWHSIEVCDCALGMNWYSPE